MRIVGLLVMLRRSLGSGADERKPEFDVKGGDFDVPSNVIDIITHAP
jgi:hypothetical protein